jgi:hypothetical protein
MHHAAFCPESKWISGRVYWSMIFLRFGSISEDEKNTGRAARSAFAVTSSDGGSAGFMALLHGSSEGRAFPSPSRFTQRC